MTEHGMLLPGGGTTAPPGYTTEMQGIDASVTSRAVDGAAECARLTGQDRRPDVDSFLTCTRGALVLGRDDAMLVSCAEQAGGDATRLAVCAGPGLIGSKLTPEQFRIVGCAAQNAGTLGGFAGCVAGGMVASGLTPDQRGVLDCAANNGVGGEGFAGCAGEALFGGRVPPEARAAVECGLQSRGDAQGFAGCAVNKFLGTHLNPEQQIAVRCVLTSGGQPYVAAGCTASNLTTRELAKCVERGIGGEGCFGDNNELVGKNGFVVRNIAALGGGPNSVMRDPIQVLGGPNSVFNNPKQFLGGPNSVPNVILKNVPSPAPIQVTKIGNHRICIPWC